MWVLKGRLAYCAKKLPLLFARIQNLIFWSNPKLIKVLKFSTQKILQIGTPSWFPISWHWLFAKSTATMSPVLKPAKAKLFLPIVTEMIGCSRKIWKGSSNYSEEVPLIRPYLNGKKCTWEFRPIRQQETHVMKYWKDQWRFLERYRLADYLGFGIWWYWTS